ncbi:MAG: hypothetical protein IT329_16995 [Caldilineaceae bacterium]|nr:hypothetical protein [Caldilineaceae bacterium]
MSEYRDSKFGGVGRSGLRLLSAGLVALAALSALVVPAQAKVTGTTCAPMPPFAAPYERFGVNVIRDYGKAAPDYDMLQTRTGWYLDYATTGATQQPVTYVRVLRISDLVTSNWRSTVEAAVTGSRGALWFIGNETDRYSQDGMPADEYARIYHRTYTYIKQLDPTATVGNAAIIQATPIRLRYLDAFVRAYAALYGNGPPVDYWNIHNFILREELETFGASIPPGLEAFAGEGKLYEVWQHGDIEIFKSHIFAFRQWMAVNGYRNVPLTVSEYGILMPPDYWAAEDGSRVYDYPFVRDFMLASFDFFLNAADPATGYPQDGNRLVQSWAWFSLNDHVIDTSQPFELWRGSNGNLMDHDTGALVALGQDFANYLAPLYSDYRDLAVRRVTVTPPEVADGKTPGTIEVEVWVQNRGNLAAGNAKVQVWWERGSQGRVLVGERMIKRIAARCNQMAVVKFSWQPGSLPPGGVTLTAEVAMGAGESDPLADNNRAQIRFLAGPLNNVSTVYLPALFQ